jgi:general secretion pathway protein M
MDGQIRAVRAALTQWFEERAPREKKLLLVCGVLVALALVYNVLWEPAYDGRAQIVAKLPLLEAQLADVQLQVDEARQLKAVAAARPPAGIALREALGASLTQAGVANAQFTVLGKGVQIDAKAVPFAAWMAWLDQVRREQHVRVINAHASAEVKQGRATVSATLQPAADR